MAPTLPVLLAELLQPGRLRLGQVLIRAAEPGLQLCHIDDEAAANLEVFTKATDARRLAQYDEAGTYRPLKTAPNLRRGWLLRLGAVADVHRALDYFYPAMLGVWRDFHAGKVTPVPLRETLGRQTGMYAITRKLTDDQAQSLIGSFCRSDTGCLKRILWPIAPGVPITTLPPQKFQTARECDEIPLFCHESCNLLVAEARKSVKLAKSS